jgi:hypothetical protein
MRLASSSVKRLRNNRGVSKITSIIWSIIFFVNQALSLIQFSGIANLL